MCNTNASLYQSGCSQPSTPSSSLDQKEQSYQSDSQLSNEPMTMVFANMNGQTTTSSDNNNNNNNNGNSSPRIIISMEETSTTSSSPQPQTPDPMVICGKPFSKSNMIKLIQNVSIFNVATTIDFNSIYHFFCFASG